MKRSKQSQTGFTLIELLLAMAFLSSILFLTTLVLTQAMNIFNKGVTVKQLSQVSRVLVEDMTRAGHAGSSPVLDSKNAGAAGCLAIGSSVYVWNVGDATSSDGYANAYYKYSNNSQPINFIRYTGSEQCPSATIDPNQATAIVGDQVRVYSLRSAKLTASALQTLTLTLGSYGGQDSDYNPFVGSEGYYQCRADGIGHYCAVSTIDTVMHLSGKSGN